MKVLSLFSGIGAFEVALDNIGIDYELVAYCDIDKFASRAYSAIHDVPETMNLKDVKSIDVDNLPSNIDLLTYGFPCQDISNAGKQQGFYNEDGSITRSGLFFEALRIIEGVKPKIAIAENVKNLVSKKFKAQFFIVLNSLEEAGYNNYYAVLNAKNYGIPQNRERVFIVSIRKDVDTGNFDFPIPVDLKLKLKDILEDTVDDKFYLTETCLKGFIEHNKRHEAKGTGFKWKPRDLEGSASCLRANSALAPTDNTIIVREATKKGYAIVNEGDSVNLEHPNSTTRRGRVGKQVAQTLTTSCNQGTVINHRVRKLTPRECFRLMGFSDAHFDKAESVCSNSQLYKQAGNSIVVNVIEAILRNIFDESGNLCLKGVNNAK